MPDILKLPCLSAAGLDLTPPKPARETNTQRAFRQLEELSAYGDMMMSRHSRGYEGQKLGCQSLEVTHTPVPMPVTSSLCDSIVIWHEMLHHSGDSFAALAEGADAHTIASRMERYAAYVADSGVYLEIVDAELFANQEGKQVSIIGHWPDRRMEVKHSVDYWSVLLEDTVAYFGEPAPLDCKEAWCFIATNASFDADNPMRNDWCVGYFKEAIPETDYVNLTAGTRSKNEEECDKMKYQLENVQLQLEAVEDEYQMIEIQTEKMYLEMELSKFLFQIVLIVDFIETSCAFERL